MSGFDESTVVSRTGDWTWSCVLSDRYNIGKVPNGGYQMSAVARALGEALTHPDPLVITGYFVGRTMAGPVDIEVEPIRTGRTTSTAMARLIQNGKETVRFLATFSDLNAGEAIHHIEGAPPVAFDREDLFRLPTVPGLTPPVLDQFALDVPMEVGGCFMGQTTDRADMHGLMRFADGREPDVWSLPLICDAWPPAWFTFAGPLSWVPTLEFTVQIRQHPAPGPLSCRFTSRFVTHGNLEEDGEVWDSEGRLVAISRQTARVRSS